MAIIIMISTPREGSMGPALKTILQACKLGLPIRLSLPGAAVSLRFGVGVGTMHFSG